MTRARSGFTLAEVLIASVIAAVALVAVTAAMSSATTTRAELARRPVVVSQLAQEIHALAEALPRTPSGSLAATSGDEVEALDSLAGARFSPPLLADRSTDTDLAGWSQHVEVAIHALDDLVHPTGESLSTELEADSHRVYRLEVTILHGSIPMETFHWWLKP